MRKASNLITNDTATLDAAIINQGQYASVTMNLKANKAKTRKDSKEGKEYLVVPCVMMTEGVHNGSRGPIFYPADELAKKPAVWNHKPVVVYHPQFNGQSVSACDPSILETYRIGELYNTKWTDGKLTTECWLDEEKTAQVDNRVLEAIENDQMMEVSTGLFTDNEMVPGEWNDEKYDSIARNHGPDHLAILPDQIGACSIEDGAGLLRNQAELTGAEALLANSLVKVFNELSHNEIWKMLNNKIRSTGSDDKWVMEVFETFFIYEEMMDGNSMLYYQEYTVEDDEVKLVGVRKGAEKIIQYRLTDGTMVGNTESENVDISFNKENEMKKKVDALIENKKSGFTEDHREFLMNCSDEQLDTFTANAAEKPAEPDQKLGDKPVEPKVETPDVPAANQTFEEFMASAPVEYQGMVNHGLKTYEAEKKQLIATITANEKNLFTPEQLGTKDVDELKAIARLAENAEKAPGKPSYAGNGEVVGNDNGEHTEEPLVMPTMNFEEDK
jgi:hypothetical protein